MPGHSLLSGYTAYSVATAAVVASVLVTSIIATTRIPKPNSREILPSPRTTLLPHLYQAQKDSLGYPPDALPGARDMSTPYGSMRVYEWGPIDGRKVIMIHGDATPSPMFGPIARQLVARGCRILTFDLWGRGYTDTPVGIQHDSRLYTQQIFYAISSSPIHWTGSDRFSLIGFSMGSTIALDFFASQPTLVESIILLGPGGLIRRLPSEYTSFYFHYPGLASRAKMRKLVQTLLGVEPTKTSAILENTTAEGFTPARALQFQFDHHAGHVDSFLSNIQYGPLQFQDKIWEKASRIISGQVTTNTPLCGGKILVICGQDDDVVIADDVKTDLTTYLGEERRHWIYDSVPGGHGFPWAEGTNIGNKIATYWSLV